MSPWFEWDWPEQAKLSWNYLEFDKFVIHFETFGIFTFTNWLALDGRKCSNSFQISIQIFSRIFLVGEICPESQTKNKRKQNFIFILTLNLVKNFWAVEDWESHKNYEAFDEFEERFCEITNFKLSWDEFGEESILKSSIWKSMKWPNFPNQSLITGALPKSCVKTPSYLHEFTFNTRSYWSQA